MARDGVTLTITGTTVTSLLSVLDGILLEIITPFWHIAVAYGLDPKYSFYGIIGTSVPYPSFYSILFGTDYFIIFDLAVTTAALVFLAMNLVSDGERTNRLVVRILMATVIPVFAFQIISLFIYSSGYVFSLLWNNLGVNWNAGLSNLNSITSFNSALSGSSTYLNAMEFFFLGGFFLATSSLIIALELRQAVLIVLTVVLPAISILFAFPGLSEYAKRFWKLFFETAVFPFITLIALYFAVRLQNNFPLQLGFMVLAGSAPVIVFSSTRLFSAGTTIGIVNGLSMERTAGRIGSLIEGGSSVSSHLGSGNPAPAKPVSIGAGNALVNWTDLYNGEFTLGSGD